MYICYIYIWMYFNVFIPCISMYFYVFLCISMNFYVLLCIYMYVYVPWSKHCLWDMVVHPTIEIVTELVVCKSLLTDWWPSPQQLGQSSIYIYLPFFLSVAHTKVRTKSTFTSHNQLMVYIIDLPTIHLSYPWYLDTCKKIPTWNMCFFFQLQWKLLPG
jgi:hypothetical protein